MDFIYQNILLIALVVVSGVALILPMLMGSGANDVNPAAATLLINREDAQVIDVREADEFAAGHLPEAKNVPLAKLADRISEIDSAQQGLDRLATSLTGITEQFSRSGFGALSANNPTNTSVEAAAEA